MAAIPTPDFRLDGKLALVTAASQGIGAAIAVALADRGADLGIGHFGDPAGAEQVAEQARAAGRHAWTLDKDLGPADAAPEAVGWLKREAGRPIDILVSGAAIQIERPWPEVTAEQVDRHVAVNLRGAFLLIQAALPDMMARGWGRVVTIGSVQEEAPEPQMPIYASLKAAQANLVKNLARQVASAGVTINNIAPGMVDTPRNATMLATEADRAASRARIPVGFIARPEDVSGAAVYLCSDAARYVTGTTILVDGGWAL